MKQFFEQLTTPEVMAEVIALILAVLLAQAIAHYIKRGLRPLAARSDLDIWSRRLVVAGMVIAPAFVALVLILGLRAAFAYFRLRVELIDIAMDLVTALALVRIGVHALSVSLGPNSWIRSWELRLTFVIWAAIAFQVLGWFSGIERTLDGIDLLPGKSQFSLWSLLKGIVVIAGFLVVTSLVARTIERRVMKLEGLAISTRIGISKFSSFTLIALGVLLGINASGVDLTALTVLTGAIGIGLGFGLQTIASNFVSGFVLLMDKSIKPGDVISFTGTTGTSSENFGWVQELRGRYIVIRDRDGVETLVPNQHFINNQVVNWSYSDQRVRIRLPVMVSFQDDPEIALQVLVDAAAHHPRILKDPGPVSRLMSFEDYGMRLEVRFWIRDPMNGVNNVRSDVNREIWRLFKKHGITIPVQQHDVRVMPHQPDLPQNRLPDQR
ncbi:MAG TPA: mechanosensitive ion channel domain-containing protein [Steroidobacteraceae bacterium]|nr:mechanosensitive ion channel domain-containing protein [Steroidobacteraceae bacterium]